MWTQLFESNEPFEQQLAEEERSSKEGGHSDDDDGDETSRDHYPALDAELSIPNSRRSALIKKLSSSIPWKNPEEFDEHINWYADHFRCQFC